jgi:hypothetical protein
MNHGFIAAFALSGDLIEKGPFWLAQLESIMGVTQNSAILAISSRRMFWGPQSTPVKSVRQRASHLCLYFPDVTARHSFSSFLTAVS